MAVEIRELVIRAVVSNNNTNSKNSAAEAGPQSQQQLVQECVSQVLKIIRQSQNR